MSDPRGTIRAKALALGFDAIGFAPAALAPSARERLQEFLLQGYHGEMAWLADRADQRSQPTNLWPEARSVIGLGLSYAPGIDALANLARTEVGNISVYARNRDYHDYFKSLLKHLAQAIAGAFGAEVKVFVDTAPVMEKPLAAQTGIGWVGKHTNLVSRRHGSWLFLGEIYTSLEIAPDAPHEDRCGSCSRCLDVCPTNAFVGAYRMDATRCISYLTIEHSGPIPIEFRASIGNRIYGCDDCLAVCPWNRFAKVATSHDKLRAREELIAPDLALLSGLTDASFRLLFAGSPVKRIGWRRFLRNVLIAIGNSGEPRLLHSVRPHLQHEDPVVAEAAAWAEARLNTESHSS